ncbi:glycosyltransferase [Paralimibaculum aggregatum]|uniref:Glycosyltransferase n=1 Tax=Paralimibaculum aggregatum TaxID=3036245 RepID=A0ABQ6LNJ4_9RHOB|nr:glycosyltransferase family 4 protein [Limibaculum sp. NKW23]GMG81835.1 glycosyltransferase [Limibaculum sp. NKW23]
MAAAMPPREAPPAPPLAVVVKGYPRLSETFVAQELKALEDRGFVFEIWSLRAPYDDRTHPIHGRIRARPRYLPEYLHGEPLRVLRGLARAARLPGFGRALRAWLGDLAREPGRSRIRRFGQAAVLAAELPAGTRFLYAHFLHTPASVARYAAMMRGLGWGVSAHAKDIWTTPDREKADKLADAAFAVTCTASGAAHLAALAAEPERVALAYHGLDLTRFPPPPAARAKGAAFRLLSVGRLVEKKGYDDLLAALAALPAELDWHLTHIGGGKLAGPLAAEAERRGLAPRIDWQGKRDQTEVIAAMRAADLFVLPAKIAGDGDRDGLPNVLMEAASQKLPILSTRVSAIPEFLPDAGHGWLVPPGEPAALAGAIAVLAGDPATRAAMAEAAHARLIRDFAMEPGIDLLAARLAAGLGDAAPAPRPAPALDRAAS